MMWRAISLMVCLGLCACGGDAAKEEPVAGNNGGGKTDTPDDSPEDSCTKRRADALYGNQALFTAEMVRWSVSDVEGVNNNNQDDRGQEYCEFFAMVHLPAEVEDGERPGPQTLGRILGFEEDATGFERLVTTDLGYELTDDQIFYIEDYEDETFGTCVFTSWHSDVKGPVPACDGGECPEVLGVPVDADVFRMKLGTNSNEAASALLADCLHSDPIVGDPANDEDPLHSDFYRGCIATANLYGTEWRRSDPAVCAAAVRMRECGCSLADGADLASTLIPPQPHDGDEGEVEFRGFPLGSWSGFDKLPPGCSYVNLGDSSQTVVTCALSGADVIDHASDLKRRCIDKYGNDLVVQVPIPQGAVTCDPPEDGAYTDTCTDTPWVVTQ